MSNPDAAHTRNESVFLMARDGSSIQRLSATEGRSAPGWGPDGRAFVSNRDGLTSIYRMASDGTGVTRLTTGHDGDWKPAWAPDGESLCFVSSRR